MTPAQIRAIVATERTAWVREMIHSIKVLPIATYDEFINNPDKIDRTL